MAERRSREEILAERPLRSDEEIEADLKDLSPWRRLRLRELAAGYDYHVPGTVTRVFSPTTEQQARLTFWDEFIADPYPHMPGPVRPRMWSSMTTQRMLQQDDTSCMKCGHAANAHYFGSKGDSNSTTSTKPGCNACRGDQTLCAGYMPPA